MFVLPFLDFTSKNVKMKFHQALKRILARFKLHLNIKRIFQIYSILTTSYNSIWSGLYKYLVGTCKLYFGETNRYLEEVRRKIVISPLNFNTTPKIFLFSKHLEKITFKSAFQFKSLFLYP